MNNHRDGSVYIYCETNFVNNETENKMKNAENKNR